MEEKATTTVKHACGHTPSDNTLATKSKHAVATSKCGLCEYKMPNTLAAIQSRQAKLQPLVGSERQVAWATTVKMERLAQQKKVFERLTKAWEVETDSSFWINTCDHAITDMLATQFLAMMPKIVSSMLPPILNKPKSADQEGDGCAS